MVTAEQVRRLSKAMSRHGVLWKAASEAGMSEKTARKYRHSGQSREAMKADHHWRTRTDPFADVWEEVRERLDAHPGLEAKTLFADLQRRFPGRYQDGQLRTLQRRIKVWRASEGPAREVFFAQEHHPGRLSQSDFTCMNSLGVKLSGQPFPHLVYHFVLTYSNWETGTICFGENYESLSAGLQSALWELGGAPEMHQTDQLTAAVHPLGAGGREEFTERYRALLAHYGVEGRKIQVAKPNQNGDVEQCHRRFKRALDQALMLRGSRDFADRAEYEAFLRKMLLQLNAGRRERLAEEMRVLRSLPERRREDGQHLDVVVGCGSTIRVRRNTYSVHSRLIGETVHVRLYAEHLEVWYAQRCMERLPRLRGERKHRINYRHVIDWLVRKPGAFANYRYRADLFPSSRFRMAYDRLRESTPARADKEYLKLLELAAREGESRVEDALRFLMETAPPSGSGTIHAKAVEELMKSGQEIPAVTDVDIPEVDLSCYDMLLPALSARAGYGEEERPW